MKYFPPDDMYIFFFFWPRGLGGGIFILSSYCQSNIKYNDKDIKNTLYNAHKNKNKEMLYCYNNLNRYNNITLSLLFLVLLVFGNTWMIADKLAKQE